MFYSKVIDSISQNQSLQKTQCYHIANIRSCTAEFLVDLKFLPVRAETPT